MAYMIHVNPHKDGSLPPALWRKTDATTKDEAIQAACNLLTLEQLPFTLHIADTKHLYPNGTPYMTTAVTIAKE